MSERTILITGSNGYLARSLVDHLLKTSAARLVLWQRRPDRSVSLDSRVSVVHGDLTDEAPFAAVPSASVHEIVHAAAQTNFNISRDNASAVNVEGTRKAIQFARNCPNLTSFTLVSTAYACGLVEGQILEGPLPPSPYANHYEWSKAEAERLVMASDLPWRVVRPATVLCHDTNGTVVQVNAIHNTLKLFYYGLLSILPGRPGTPVHLTVGEDAVRSLVEAPDRPMGDVSHVVSATLPLQDFLDVAYRSFQTDASFAGRRVMQPLLCKLDAFERLRDATNGFGGDVLTEALDSVAPFAPQLFSPKQFAGAGVHANAGALVQATCSHLLQNRWKRGVRRVA